MLLTNTPYNIVFHLGSGEMSELIRLKDWSKTTLGKLDTWPQSLRTTLSIILNSKFPMFLFWGPDLICFYNDAYRQSLGNNGKHPAILGGRAEEYWKEIWADIKPIIDHVLAGGEANWSEDQLLPIYRNGEMEDVYWTFSYSAVYDESGKPAGVFVTCTETTNKVIALKNLKKREIQFVESEERFRTLADNISQLAWMADKTGFIYWYNQRWYDYTGTTLEDMQGWGWKKVHHPDHVDRVVKRVQHSWDTGELWEDTFPLRGQDGLYRWFLSRATPIRDDEGKVLNWFGTNTDITEQKVAEDKFRTLADQAPMWVWMTDLQLNIQYANSEVLKYIGISHYTEFTGLVWQKSLPAESLPSVFESFKYSIENQTNFDPGTVVTRIAGNMFVEKVDVQDAAGRPRTELFDAVLIRIGVEPNSELARDVLELDEAGYVRVDQNGETSAANVYAVGDVANRCSPTLSTAAGTAATSAKAIFLSIKTRKGYNVA